LHLDAEMISIENDPHSDQARIAVDIDIPNPAFCGVSLPSPLP
jgi:hypothetical protein